MDLLTLFLSFTLLNLPTDEEILKKQGWIIKSGREDNKNQVFSRFYEGEEQILICSLKSNCRKAIEHCIDYSSCSLETKNKENTNPKVVTEEETEFAEWKKKMKTYSFEPEEIITQVPKKQEKKKNEVKK